MKLTTDVKYYKNAEGDLVEVSKVGDYWYGEPGQGSVPILYDEEGNASVAVGDDGDIYWRSKPALNIVAVNGAGWKTKPQFKPGFPFISIDGDGLPLQFKQKPKLRDEHWGFDRTNFETNNAEARFDLVGMFDGEFSQSLIQDVEK